MNNLVRIAGVGLGALLFAVSVWMAWPSSPDEGMSEDEERELMQEIGYLK